MRKLFILITAVAAGYISALAQTQSGLNANKSDELAQTDERLNAVYTQIMEKYGNDRVFIGRMKKAQRAWLAFREAHLEAVYPAPDKQREYGSAFPMCNSGVRTALTDQRIEQLSAWLSSTEGDVCAGSRTPWKSAK